LEEGRKTEPGRIRESGVCPDFDLGCYVEGFYLMVCSVF
jgi:hypothetical protein